MPSRTQFVCLHEGSKGRSIDGVFINTLIKAIKPSWLRKTGSNVLRLRACGGRKELIDVTPRELKLCLQRGGHTTLMVWADLDDDIETGDQLKSVFWKRAEEEGISRADFDDVVFIFAKDRLENWIQFLEAGATDEAAEGPRINENKVVARAARKLADWCTSGRRDLHLPESLKWSCKNWHHLVERLKG